MESEIAILLIFLPRIVSALFHVCATTHFFTHGHVVVFWS